MNKIRLLFLLKVALVVNNMNLFRGSFRLTLWYRFVEAKNPMNIDPSQGKRNAEKVKRAKYERPHLLHTITQITKER
ncbi:MAG: hypothetical protein K2X27_24850 [Candidatus Obscuribacterales bacterium]|nr:hypothetical protein [Candidatus Obscuribacterales bacterium]